MLKRIAFNLIALKYLVNLEKESNNIGETIKKIPYFIKGFSSEKYRLYNFEENSPYDFLSDFQRRKAAIVNEKYSIILSDKLLFERLTNEYTAKVFGWIRDGKVYLSGELVSQDYFLKFIKDNNNLIIKMNNGSGGKGVYKIHFSNNTIRLNDTEITEKYFDIFVESLNDYLICEYLIQEEYSNRIYPGTVNTIRVITMVDPITNEVFIPIAVHRFGSEKTKPADNVWKGGMTALVDLETGILQKSAYHYNNNKKIEWMELHPDTNERIEGTVIPEWETVKDEVIKFAEKNKFLKYVGWDVVIVKNGIKIIEGNHCSDVNILQIHQPLLNNQRVRQFFEYYKVI